MVITISMFCAGGHDGIRKLNNILQFDGETQQWTQIGTLKRKRHYHAASVIDVSKIEEYCN